MDFYDVSMKLNMYSRSQKPAALVIKGKFKTFDSLQSAVKTEKFLSNRGFHNIKNITSDYFNATYFVGRNKGRESTPILSIVHAEIKN